MSPEIQFKRLPTCGVEIKRCTYTNQCYKEHLHEELSIAYIESGSTTVNFCGKDYRYCSGDGIMIPPMISHICRPDDIHRWKVVMLYIDRDILGQDISGYQLHKLSEVELSALKSFIVLAGEELGVYEIENALLDLLTTCMDCNHLTHVSHHVKIQELYDYIIQHYLDKVSLDTLQELTGLNKFYMIRAFKSTYNTTPSALQLQLKVVHAKKLLAKGENVLDVCQESGFYDQAHFSREFKKANGISPLQYQKNVLSHHK